MILSSPTSNRFCVPAALACLLDIHVDEACKFLKEEIGDSPIRGIFYPLILKLLKEQGYRFEQTSLNSVDTFLLCFHGHVGVLKKGVYYDNSFPQGTTLPKRKVEHVFKISKEPTNG